MQVRSLFQKMYFFIIEKKVFGHVDFLSELCIFVLNPYSPVLRCRYFFNQILFFCRLNLRVFVCVAVLTGCVRAVDKNNFKTCDQSSFCRYFAPFEFQVMFFNPSIISLFFRRLRSVKPEETKYELNLNSLQVNENSVETELLNVVQNAKFKLTLTALAGDAFRVFIEEVDPLHPRYVVQESLAGELELAGLVPWPLFLSYIYYRNVLQKGRIYHCKSRQTVSDRAV